MIYTNDIQIIKKSITWYYIYFDVKNIIKVSISLHRHIWCTHNEYAG